MPFLDDAFYAFIAILVITDPVGTAAVFPGLTAGTDRRHRRRMALRGVVIAFFTLIGFAIAGNLLLKALGISLGAFRIAGGLLLFATAFNMVMSYPEPSKSFDSTEAEAKFSDISVFPLAIPLLAGPGSIAAILLLMGNAGGDWRVKAAVLAALVAVYAITLICLLAAGWITAVLGETGANLIRRILGIVLAALAVQFVADGIKQLLAAGPGI
ncbi:MAG: NAAT family transporter [Azospirillum sp.]|nr:NAAT family transporter [Azospirillum sp.]